MLDKRDDGRRLKEEMRRCKWTAARLAERVGITRSGVSSWVKTGRIDRQHFPLFEQLGFDTTYILTGKRMASGTPAPTPAPVPTPPTNPPPSPIDIDVLERAIEKLLAHVKDLVKEKPRLKRSLPVKMEPKYAVPLARLYSQFQAGKSETDATTNEILEALFGKARVKKDHR